MSRQTTQHSFQSQLIPVTHFSDIKSIDSSTLVISDILFKSSLSGIFKSKNALVYFVESGEKIKSIETFTFHLRKINTLTEKKDIKTVVALGGGSIGDFAGFFASIFKRGVNFIQIPSTWLGALDSAHGGKTALNGFHAKNQYGSFYPAQKVYLCKDILLKQPEMRAIEAFGELYKISLITGNSLWKKISSLERFDNKIFWKLLKPAVIEKYKIVLKDPYEKKKIRQILNLGHTLGHAYEVKFKIHHGLAVSHGLLFCLQYSLKKGFMTQDVFSKIIKIPIYSFFQKMAHPIRLKDLTRNELRKLLLQDKKRSDDHEISFVFLKQPGQPLIKSVSIQEILDEFNRQKSMASPLCTEI